MRVRVVGFSSPVLCSAFICLDWPIVNSPLAVDLCISHFISLHPFVSLKFNAAQLAANRAWQQSNTVFCAIGCKQILATTQCMPNDIKSSCRGKTDPYNYATHAKRQQVLMQRHNRSIQLHNACETTANPHPEARQIHTTMQCTPNVIKSSCRGTTDPYNYAMHAKRQQILMQRQNRVALAIPWASNGLI